MGFIFRTVYVVCCISQFACLEPEACRTHESCLQSLLPTLPISSQIKGGLDSAGCVCVSVFVRAGVVGGVMAVLSLVNERVSEWQVRDHESGPLQVNLREFEHVFV